MTTKKVKPLIHKEKPGIIAHSHDGDDTFRWSSCGWATAKQRIQDPEARKRMHLVEEIVDKAKDVREACRMLKKAGFKIIREGDEGWYPG